MNRTYAITAHLPTHTEYWYASSVPRAGTTFVRYGEEYEVVSCQPDGEHRFVVELEKAGVDGRNESPPTSSTSVADSEAVALLAEMSAGVAELGRVAWNVPPEPVSSAFRPGKAERDWRLGLDSVSEMPSHAGRNGRT